MTDRLPFTQHSLRRAIAAAQKAGLRVRGIKPDGTVLVDDGTDPVADHAPSHSKWEDAEA